MKKKKYSKSSTNKHFEAIVIGVSAGGINALSHIVSSLPPTYCLPIILVQHVSARSENYLVNILQKSGKIKVKEVDEKEALTSGTIYVAPPNYHILIEEDHTFSLSTEERVSFSRPSIDVLFESAAYVFTSKLIGVILTGANNDGAQGLSTIKQMGGTAIVQNPATAEVNSMPIAAIKSTNVDYILDLEEIGPKLIEIGCI